MSDELLEVLRAVDARYTEDEINGLPLAYRDRRNLLAEVDRLRAELTEARLSAEEAWAARDEKETR